MIRSIAIAGLTASALLLGSCMTDRPATSSAMAWSLHQTPEEGAKLAYGMPASDNVVIMLTCQPGAGEVLVSTNAAAPADSIVLKSGPDTSAIAATSAPSGMGDGQFLEASAKPSDKALAGFARTGDLTLVQPDRSLKLTTTRNDRVQIGQFFKSCAA